MRSVARQRRAVGPVTLRLLRPVLRYSTSRDAYVLRVVGRSWGPVLQVRGQGRRELILDLTVPAEPAVVWTDRAGPGSVIDLRRPESASGSAPSAS